mmetsp:Transcript_42409/g.141042  ORF Transcript_42409/g.141042 Transcript_42409/m.141042 type:complete len:411 (-) Transcript_42409:327-1559(-)
MRAAALVLLLAYPAIAVSPALSPAPRVFLARQRPLRAAPRCSSSDPATEVARWCVANGQSDAAVVVSGATGLAEAMRDFWYVTHSIGTASDAAPLTALAFPAWSAAADGSLFERVFQHVGSCSQLSDFLGDDVLCLARHPTASDSPPLYPTMLLQRRAQSGFSSLSSEEDEYFGGVDPFAELEARLALDAPPPPPPASDEQVLATTHAWVKAVIVDMKVCPFSHSVDKAGLPQGGVTYPITRASSVEQLYQAFWEQVGELDRVDEREVATVLLLAPEFTSGSAEGFDAFADSLNEALTSLKLEEKLQLVFFHPGFAFRDGKERMGGEGAAANFARRSPVPMINLLRTPQVRAAQKGIPTGSVYDTNEKNLASVGSEQLQEMLHKCEWSALEGRTYLPHQTRAAIESAANR